MLNYGGQHNTVSMHYNDWCPGRNGRFSFYFVVKLIKNFYVAMYWNESSFVFFLFLAN